MSEVMMTRWEEAKEAAAEIIRLRKENAKLRKENAKRREENTRLIDVLRQSQEGLDIIQWLKENDQWTKEENEQ